MNANLVTINYLLPRRWEVTGSYAYVDWRCVFGSPEIPEIFVPAKPHIWVPKLSLPAAAAIGAAAAIVKNPEMTRRFWAGWSIA